MQLHDVVERAPENETGRRINLLQGPHVLHDDVQIFVREAVSVGLRLLANEVVNVRRHEVGAAVRCNENALVCRKRGPEDMRVAALDGDGEEALPPGDVLIGIFGVEERLRKDVPFFLAQTSEGTENYHAVLVEPALALNAVEHAVGLRLVHPVEAAAFAGFIRLAKAHCLRVLC